MADQDSAEATALDNRELGARFWRYERWASDGAAIMGGCYWVRSRWRCEFLIELAAGVRSWAMSKVTMLFGLVGAGKTTLARRLEDEGAVRLSLDDWTIAASGDHRHVDPQDSRQAHTNLFMQIYLYRDTLLVCHSDAPERQSFLQAFIRPQR